MIVFVDLSIDCPGNVWLVGFLTSSLTTRLYRGRVPRLTSDNFMCNHTRDSAGRPWLLSQPVTLY